MTHTVLHAIANVDGKIWRTLRLLLFKPAFLALEYSAGRRHPYVNPLRILITAIIIYALATTGGLNIQISFYTVSLSVAPVPVPAERSIEDTLFQVDQLGILERRLEAKFGPAEAVPAEVRNRFNRGLASFATPLSFTVVLLLAFALYALFRRRRPLFVEHLVFSMHYFSFVLLWSLIAVIGIALGVLSISWLTTVLVLATVAWQFAYLTIALRRFYLPTHDRAFLAWLAAVRSRCSSMCSTRCS